MSYEVRTSVFEGPFDLLLHLILKQEVDLWDVSLTTLVDEYLAEVERMGNLDLEVATEFLLIAATLVELKARRLLPGLEDTELDEELLRFEERDLLLARLLECKTFQDVARTLESRMRSADRSIPRRAGPEEPFRSLVPDVLERTGLARFATSARRVLAPREEPIVSIAHLAPIRVSVREAAEHLVALLPERDAVSFAELVDGLHERLDVIVRFLAVLELFKQGVVDIEQLSSFGDLKVRRLADGETALDAASLADWDDQASSRGESSRGESSRGESSRGVDAARELTP